MADNYSFDITSDYDHQEMLNAVDQLNREITNRFDFKGVFLEIDYNEKDKCIEITTESEYKLSSILDILESKMVKRNIDLKVLDKSLPEDQASGGNIRKKVTLRSGLNTDDAKKITKIIRESFPKSKQQIQGAEIRITSKSKDELQQIMQHLKQSDIEIPLQYGNYR
jgi:uncharacterized protein YajQ (UPF0234 family)